MSGKRHIDIPLVLLCVSYALFWVLSTVMVVLFVKHDDGWLTAGMAIGVLLSLVGARLTKDLFDVDIPKHWVSSSAGQGSVQSRYVKAPVSGSGQ